MKKQIISLLFAALMTSTSFAVSLESEKTVKLTCTNILGREEENTVKAGITDEETFFVTYDRWTGKVRNADYKKFLDGLEKAKKWLSVAKEKKLVTHKDIFALGYHIDDFRKTGVLLALVSTEKQSIIGMYVSEGVALGKGGLICFSSTEEIDKFIDMLKSLPDLKKKLKEKQKEADELLN